MVDVMKIVLTAINAKYIHSNLAVYCLRSMLPLDSEILIEEYTINQTTEFILASLYRHKPDVILFSCYIWNISIVEQLTEDLSKLLPKTDLWLGGPEVSYNAKERMEHFIVLTGILMYEGEETFLELMEYYQGKRKKLSDITGIVYRENDVIFSTKERRQMALEHLPFPYKPYRGRMECFENKILYYESSRGCPYGCSYCLSSINKKLRLRNLTQVKEELGWFLEQRVLQVKFVDRTFNVNKKHALAIWNYIKLHDNGITNFHFEIAADLLDEEMLQLLCSLRPGQIQLEIGIQSANEKTLASVNRQTDLEKVTQIVAALVKQGNIHLHLDLIAGLPYEDEISFESSFNYAYTLRPHQLQLGFLKILKGTQMEKKIDDYGILFSSRPPFEVRTTKWLSYDAILRLKAVEEVLEWYYNSGQFKNTLCYLESFFLSPFAMYRELAQYYEWEGLLKVSQSRLSRYEILLKFSEQKLNRTEYHQAVKELLTIDYYLRENAKKRPEFAASQEPYLPLYRMFFSRKEQGKGYGKQFHFEHITVDLHEAKRGKRVEKDCFILFDYLDKSPLFEEARIIVMKEEDLNGSEKETT